MVETSPAETPLTDNSFQTTSHQTTDNTSTEIRSTKRLVILRHAETAWSLSGQHTGHTDLPLDPSGIKQAELVGPRFTALGLHNPIVFSSPLQRARRTAELAGLHIDRLWDELVEWDYGDYEGLTGESIRAQVPEWTVWTYPCPNGESPENVMERADLVLSAVKPILQERDVVLVSHGHFSRALIARWSGLEIIEGRRFAMGACAYSVLGFDRETNQILHHNVTGVS